MVQKSLVEGFGLTVTEPMWKARPVARLRRRRHPGPDRRTAQSGLLLDDPLDLATFAERLHDLLTDEEYARMLGTAARSRVRDLYLGDRHLTQYVDLFEQLYERGAAAEQGQGSGHR